MNFVRSIVRFIFVFFILFMFGNLVKADYLNCYQTGPCSCNGDNFTFHLQDLAFANSSRFTVNATTNSSIFLNFCNSFQLGNDSAIGTCGQKGGVAVCLKNNTSNSTESWGTQRSAKFQYNLKNKLFQIEYTDNYKGINVALNCSYPNLTEPYIFYDRYNSTTFTHFVEFRAQPCACNGTCVDPGETTTTPTTTTPTTTTPTTTTPTTNIPTTTNSTTTIPSPPEPPKHGLSTGSILLIIFFVFVGVYLFGGILYRGCFLGATGVEMIPNYDFWMDFPVLVKDGVNYLFSCCKQQPSYDNI